MPRTKYIIAQIAAFVKGVNKEKFSDDLVYSDKTDVQQNRSMPETGGIAKM